MTHALKQHGFEFFDDLPVDRTTTEIAAQFGHIFKPPRMSLVQSLTPRTAQDESIHTYSGTFGYDDFPLHTDMAHWHRPPRYILLRCVIPDSTVSTNLMAAARVLPSSDDIIAKRSLFKPRQRLDNKMFFLKVSEPEFWRWDSVFLTASNSTAVELKRAIETRLARERFQTVRFTRHGQVLIFDNWMMLHGRSRVTNRFSPRRIERVYLEALNQ